MSKLSMYIVCIVCHLRVIYYVCSIFQFNFISLESSRVYWDSM